MLCPKCNTEINDGSKFCLECGLNIEEYNRKNISEDKQICSNCGKEIDKTAKFCNYCGYNLQTEQETQNTKRGTNWIIIIICSIIGFLILKAVVLNIADKASNPPPQESYDYSGHTSIQYASIDITSDRLISQGYGMYEINGVIKNNSNSTCFAPYVNITTYDSSGNIVTQLSPVYINSLAPGESYRFEFHDMNISRYKIKSYGCR